MIITDHLYRPLGIYKLYRPLGNAALTEATPCQLAAVTMPSSSLVLKMAPMIAALPAADRALLLGDVVAFAESSPPYILVQHAHEGNLHSSRPRPELSPEFV